ncbi:MAG: protease [Herbinix sp.]|jgi:membrane protease YdiL (CAAX protease family)|nr:protease [Herbinix sp.]
MLTWHREILLFALSTILLPPLAEELFYRQSLICFDHKKRLPLLIIISSLLFALEHSLTPFGILIALIWSIPLMISYIKTKNVYVVIVAHFISNFVVNGLDIISIIDKMF